MADSSTIGCNFLLCEVSEVIDEKELAKQWGNYAIVQQRAPKLFETCDLILELCVEIGRLKKEVESESKRQDVEKQKYKTMLMEIQNTVQRYT